MSTAATTHVDVDENGVAWIDGTNVKVIEIVIDKLAHGSSPEEMHFQYPHLSLAQIHAALTYYYDHQAEMEAEVGRRRREADELAEAVSDSALRQKLSSLKATRGEAGPSSTTLRRGRGQDTWHWCLNCSTWPTSDYEERKNLKRPRGGGLCSECSAKEKAGSCRR